MTSIDYKEPIGFHFRRKAKMDMEVPISIEQILFSAAEDEAFCQAFLSKREQALHERGFRLIPSERDILAAIPQNVLEKLIQSLRPQKQTAFAKRNIWSQSELTF